MVSLELARLSSAFVYAGSSKSAIDGEVDYHLVKDQWGSLPCEHASTAAL